MQRVENVISAQGNNLSDLINRYAELEGVPAVGLLAGLISESNLNEQAERIGVWPDWSVGLGQQTLAYARVGDHTPTAENLTVCRNYYGQPEHAIAEAARQYGACYRQYGSFEEAWSRYNGGPGMAYADNPNAANLRRGWNAAQLYLAPEGDTPMHFDPDAPPFRQRQDWTCSVNAAAWCLAALGIDVTPGDMQDRMQAAGLVSPADGLEDGSGGSLARWLSETFGVQVNVAYPADWAEVKDYAGTGPIALGGQRLNHWLAVRRPSPDTDALEVMNPAPNWQGIGDELSHAEWDAWGPWAAIYLTVPSEEANDLSQAERDELASLRDLKVYTDALVGAGGILPSALGTLEAAASGKSSRAELANIVRGQTAAIRAAAGI